MRRYEVEVFRCKVCGRPVRGQHPDVAADQYGATAHRVGPRVKAAAHTLHYGLGVPVRKLPAVFRELKGVNITQGALTQDALRRAKGEVGTAYQILRAAVPQQPTVNTDDTGFSIHGDPAWMMAFDTPVSTVYQIRRRHRNEEVRELIPSDYAGVMGTDRGPSYDAEELLGVAQQNAWRICNATLPTWWRPSAARRHSSDRRSKGYCASPWTCGKRTIGARRRITSSTWTDWKSKSPITSGLASSKMLTITMLDGIGLPHDRGNLLRFLREPSVEPANNRPTGPCCLW